MKPDAGAGADGRERLRLGEDLGVGADADLEILRPEAACDERRFEPRRLLGAGLDAGESVRRTPSAAEGSPLVCSSITRSKRLRMKVTPAALIA
jgi:hypothetical protein